MKGKIPCLLSALGINASISLGIRTSLLLGRTCFFCVSLFVSCPCLCLLLFHWRRKVIFLILVGFFGGFSLFPFWLSSTYFLPCFSLLVVLTSLVSVFFVLPRITNQCVLLNVGSAKLDNLGRCLQYESSSHCTYSLPLSYCLVVGMDITWMFSCSWCLLPKD